MERGAANLRPPRPDFKRNPEAALAGDSHLPETKQRVVARPWGGGITLCVCVPRSGCYGIGVDLETTASLNPSPTSRSRWLPEAPPGLPAPAASLGETTDRARWFAEEVQPHEARLRAWLRARFSTLRDIDDVVQEAYLRIWRARAGGRIEHPKSYLFNTARNAALDRVRRERVVPFERLTDRETSFVLEGGDDAGSNCDAELELLAAAVRALPQRCREVFILRKYHGLSHEAIAARLGITPNTVNAQITAAMIRCREHFRAHGLLRKDRHAK